MKSVLLLLPGFLLLLVAVQLAAKERGRLTLGADGGFRDLVIAIDRTTPEDPWLVDKIKAMMQQFNEQLSTATNPLFSNNASLRLSNVFILVPKTWTNRTYTNVSFWQTYENAEIRLGRSPEAPHYTINGLGCGSVGDHIVLDTNHTRDTGAYWLGKQLLYEFGQFRWGLRPEHNGEKGPHFYLKGGKIVPALCTQDIKGSFRDKITQQKCDFDPNTLETTPTCRFYPDLKQDVAEASLLSTTISRDIIHFCENTRDSPSDKIRHNRQAPVPMNSQCRGRSARDIMRQSPDFRRSPQFIPTLPPVQFTVVRPWLYRRLVIIIDVSSSMNGDPINKIKTGIDAFILEKLEDGIECAVVIFNQIATVVKPLAHLNTLATKQEYARAVRSVSAGGYTAIGEGLVQGMKLLGVNPWSPSTDKPGYMLLLSDGDENRFINFTLSEAANVLKQTSIIVDTVSFGRQADKRLTQLSKDTNGYSFFCRFENSTNDFLEELSKMVRDRVEANLKPVDIFSSPIKAQFSIPINIDSSVARDTSFLLSTYRAADISNMDLRIASPNGTVYDRTSPQYIKDMTLGTVTLKLAGQVQAGRWIATDGRSAMVEPAWSNTEVFNTRAALTVSSKPSVLEEPVILDGSVLGETEITVNGSTEVVIAASLARGAQLYRGAKILAKIESESSDDAVLELQDSGVYPDAQVDDGIYSALVPLKSIMKVQEYNVRLISELPVARVTSAGKIAVKAVDTGSLQNLPPAIVQDLKVAVDLRTQTLRLSFTAVGNEQNEGTAASYIVKSSLNDTLLLEKFHSADNVSVTITPLPAGSQLTVNISSSDLANYNGSTFYIAVLAVSSKGVNSAVSNVVATQLIVPDNIGILDGGSTTVMPEFVTTKTGARAAETYCGFVTGLMVGLACLLSSF